MTSNINNNNNDNYNNTTTTTTTTNNNNHNHSYNSCPGSVTHLTRRVVTIMGQHGICLTTDYNCWFLEMLRVDMLMLKEQPASGRATGAGALTDNSI